MVALSNDERADLTERGHNSQCVWNKENRAAEKEVKPDRTNIKSRKNLHSLWRLAHLFLNK